jgi:hypothetical protein
MHGADGRVNVYDDKSISGIQIASLGNLDSPPVALLSSGPTMVVQLASDSIIPVERFQEQSQGDASPFTQHFAGTFLCETITAANSGVLACSSEANELLQRPVCAINGPPQGCSVACAELWLPLAQAPRCAHESDTFQNKFSAITDACMTTATQLLSTIAPTISVSGFRCHATANAKFVLQTVPFNEHAHYQTVTSPPLHMYWSSNAWHIGETANLNGGKLAHKVDHIAN